MIKRLLSGLVLVIASLFLMSSINVKAYGSPIEIIDGASIRTEGEQGLRFYAKLDESVKGNAHGFYVAFGKVSLEQLEEVLDDDPMILNGKAVHKIYVDSVNLENEFSVVLTGIPEVGYMDKITVIPFVVVGQEEMFAGTIDRSIGEVALKMANRKDDIGEDIITYVENNYKRIGFNIFGNLELTNNLFEDNHILLREEFLHDWNTHQNQGWETLSGGALQSVGGVGFDTYNLSGTRLYKFFNDPLYRDKWHFLLQIMVYKGSEITKLQAKAYLGDGTVEETINLQAGRHLHYSIANFFNGEHEVYDASAVNFSSPLAYLDIMQLISGVYVNASYYDFHMVGDFIELLEAPSIDGYTFSHYKVGEETYNVGSIYEVTIDDVIFEPIYEPTTYNIDFYYGEEELINLKETYTILDSLEIDPYVKEDFIFKGWYDNPEFNGPPITNINIGTFGNITLYAKGIESIYAEVEVTYNLNGGSLTNYEELLEYHESDKVVATRYADSGDSYGYTIVIGGKALSQWYTMAFKETELLNVYELVGKGKAYSNQEATLYINYYDNVVSPYKEVLQGVYATIGVGDILVVPWLPASKSTLPTSIDLFFMDGDALTKDVVTYLIDPEEMPIEPIKEGFVFAGWYKDEELLDGPVNIYPGYLPVEDVLEVTYYAKWEEE